MYTSAIVIPNGAEVSCDEDKHRHNAKGHSRHIVITVITRYQLIKSVHVLIELVIPTCELEVKRQLHLTRNQRKMVALSKNL